MVGGFVIKLIIGIKGKPANADFYRFLRKIEIPCGNDAV